MAELKSENQVAENTKDIEFVTENYPLTRYTSYDIVDNKVSAGDIIQHIVDLLDRENKKYKFSLNDIAYGYELTKSGCDVVMMKNFSVSSYSINLVNIGKKVIDIYRKTDDNNMIGKNLTSLVTIYLKEKGILATSVPDTTNIFDEKVPEEGSLTEEEKKSLKASMELFIGEVGKHYLDNSLQGLSTGLYLYTWFPVEESDKKNFLESVRERIPKFKEQRSSDHPSYIEERMLILFHHLGFLKEIESRGRYANLEKTVVMEW